MDESSQRNLPQGAIPKFDRYEDYHGEIQSRHITALFNHIVGQMLTVMDASISDPIQRDALKQIIKEKIWSNNEEMQLWLYQTQYVKELKEEASTGNPRPSLIAGDGTVIFPY